MKYSIGIDFGTCNSIISIFQNHFYAKIAKNNRFIASKIIRLC